jgi:hypothetical protein
MVGKLALVSSVSCLVMFCNGQDIAANSFNSYFGYEPVGGTLPGYPIFNVFLDRCMGLCTVDNNCNTFLYKVGPGSETTCWLKPAGNELKKIGQGLFCNDGSTCYTFRKPLPSPPALAISGFLGLGRLEPDGDPILGPLAYSATSCQRLCSQRTLCKYALHKKTASGANLCYLKGVKSVLKPQSEAVVCSALDYGSFCSAFVKSRNAGPVLTALTGQEPVGTTLFGYPKYNVVDYNGCANLCRQDSACRGIIFKEGPGDVNQICWLKFTDSFIGVGPVCSTTEFDQVCSAAAK